MKADKASATARLIAAATVMCAKDPKTANLVAPGATEWCEAFLSTSRADRWLASSGGFGMSRGAWKLLERATHPGIVRHWMARKNWIERRVRQSLAEGISQVVVLGAGLDTLGVRLVAEHPDVRFVEIDHPATLAVKRAVIGARFGRGGPILAEADFSREGGVQLPSEALIRDRPTLFLAEGLLMYLSEARVRSLLGGLSAMTTSGSRLIFSFMVERENGEIGFEPRSPLVTWWLARKQERFLWSLDPAKAGEFVKALGWNISSHANAETLASISDSDQLIARGEEIIEATLTGS